MSTVVPFPAPPPRPSLVAGPKRRSGIEASVAANIDKELADSMLLRAGLHNGDFVLRESRSHPGSFVVCVVEHGEVRHYPLERCDDPAGYNLLSPEPPRFFSSIDQTIEFYKHTVEGITVRLRNRVV